MQVRQKTNKEILFVGDAIHVMNPVVQEALDRLDERPLAGLARRRPAFLPKLLSEAGGMS